MKKHYVGSWSANNGSTYNYGYDETSLRRLCKLMRSICSGNMFAGNTGHWSVFECDENGNQLSPEPIMFGVCR